MNMTNNDPETKILRTCWKCNKIRKILEWWDRLACPYCGNELKTNRKLGRYERHWSHGDYIKCSNNICTYKRDLGILTGSGEHIDEDDYFQEIKEVLKDD